MAFMTKSQAIEWGGNTQRALAEKLGMAQSSIAEWGEYPPPMAQLRIQKCSNGRLRAEPWVIEGRKQPK